MKLNYGIKNVISGLFKQLSVIILGLILPRLILINYGSEVNGFISSINQLITYLALLEIGVGTASIQALYGPISNNDINQINSIMSATHQYYKKTGYIYFIVVIFVSLIYPYFVSSSILKIEMSLFIFFSGISGVLNYFFQGKIKILLQAQGKNYIITNINIIISIMTNVIKIFLAYNGVSIVLLQMSYFILNIIQILIISIYAKNQYSWLNFKCRPNFKAISQRKSVLIHELSYLIFKHTDVMTLTIFTNLSMVSVYTVYFMVFSLVNTILSTLSTSFQYYFGQVYSRSVKTYKKLFDIFELLFLNISFSLYIPLYILIVPFIKIYTNNIMDANYLMKYLPVLFIIVEILTGLRTIYNQIINVSGQFYNTKWITIIEAIININLSIILSSILEIYGVLIATIIALLFRNISIMYYTSKNIINKNMLVSFKRIVINVSVLFLVKSIVNPYVDRINNYLHLLLMSAILFISSMIILLLISIFIDKKTLKNIIVFAKNSDAFE